jgi:hypothetical protein
MGWHDLQAASFLPGDDEQPCHGVNLRECTTLMGPGWASEAALPRLTAPGSQPARTRLAQEGSPRGRPNEGLRQSMWDPGHVDRLRALPPFPLDTRVRVAY